MIKWNPFSRNICGKYLTLKQMTYIFLLIVLLLFCTSCAGRSVGSEALSICETSEAAQNGIMGAASVEAPTGTASAVAGENTEILALTVNEVPIRVSWERNASVNALMKLAENGAITIHAERYGGFEQVGALPKAIKSQNQRITTEPGDIVLYAGDSIVLFYGSNTWAYTKLGHIEDMSAQELETLLSGKQAVITLSLN